MNLKECRERAGYRQADAAAAMGVSEQAYSCWERGTRNFTFIQAIKLADFYGCSLDELAGRKTHVAEIVPMPETAIHARMRATFNQLNHQGREALAEMADSFLRVPAFVDGGGGAPSRDIAIREAV